MLHCIEMSAYSRVINVLGQRGIRTADMVDTMTQGGDEQRKYLQIVEILCDISTLNTQQHQFKLSFLQTASYKYDVLRVLP